MNNDVRYLLKEKYHHNESEIIEYFDNGVSVILSAEANRDIEKLKNGTPLAYLLGYTYFNDLKIKVIDENDCVLIPRSETEYLLGKVMDELKVNFDQDNISVLDIFCGSGCIGLSLLKSFSHLQVDFVDIEVSALRFSKINYDVNLSEIRKNLSLCEPNFIQSDMFMAVDNKYNFIFANPPYVSNDEYLKNEYMLRYEPKIALVADNSGLAIIYKFLDQAFDYLENTGLIFLEFGDNQSGYICDYLKKYSANIKFQVYKDQFDKERWIKIEKP